jgi:hypothetical protein
MGVIMIRFKTVGCLIFYCATGWIGLRANEDGRHVIQFCNKDLRFREHLLQRDDLSDEKNRLKNTKISHLAMLISFVKDHKVNLLIRKGTHDQINETYISIEKNNEADAVNTKLNFVIYVNPKGDFASAYFSTVRELIIARLILESIHDGKITDSLSFEDFSKIYKTIHKQVIGSILEDFDELDGDWIKSEGIEADVKRWKKNELSQVSKKGENLSDILKIRAKLFFDSYKSVFDGA